MRTLLLLCLLLLGCRPRLLRLCLCRLCLCRRLCGQLNRLCLGALRLCRRCRVLSLVFLFLHSQGRSKGCREGSKG